MKVTITSKLSSALRSASCMMDSPTDTRMRPGGGGGGAVGWAQWEGGSRSGGGRRTPVALAHEMQVHWRGKRELSTKDQNCFAEDGGDEKCNRNGRRRVGDSSDADYEGGVNADNA